MAYSEAKRFAWGELKSLVFSALSDRPRSTGELSLSLNLPVKTVYKVLCRMHQSGEIRCTYCGAKPQFWRAS